MVTRSKRAAIWAKWSTEFDDGGRALKVIGIGDNVVDDYVHIRTMFPGGNALNISVYATMLGCESAYLGVFGNDAAAEH